MKKDRRTLILNIIEQHGEMSTRELAESLACSEATVRRDADALAEEGLLNRFHGGIGRKNDPVQQLPLLLRRQQNSAHKQLLARRAAEFITPGATVFVYGGSTVLFLGLYLKNCTVITNSIELGSVFNNHWMGKPGAPEVIITGGRLHYIHALLVGPGARNSVDRYRCDFAIGSSYAVDENGLIEVEDEPLDIQNRMFEHARQRILIADETKFDRGGLCRGLSWSSIDFFITPENPRQSRVLQRIGEQGCQVITLKTPAAETSFSADSHGGGKVAIFS